VSPLYSEGFCGFQCLYAYNPCLGPSLVDHFGPLMIASTSTSTGGHR
jgi:hypothetical protein